MTTPDDAEPVEPTDNRPRDEDGDQDVTQDPDLDYSEGQRVEP